MRDPKRKTVPHPELTVGSRLGKSDGITEGFRDFEGVSVGMEDGLIDSDEKVLGRKEVEGRSDSEVDGTIELVGNKLGKVDGTGVGPKDGGVVGGVGAGDTGATDSPWPRPSTAKLMSVPVGLKSKIRMPVCLISPNLYELVLG